MNTVMQLNAFAGHLFVLANRRRDRVKILSWDCGVGQAAGGRDLRSCCKRKTGRKSEQLSREQLALFAAELGLDLPEAKDSDDHDEEPPPTASASGSGKSRGRNPLPRHLKRERIEHDLPESEKHCAQCDQDLRRVEFSRLRM